MPESLFVHPVNSHFLDSGAFSLFRKPIGKEELIAYMDRYAAFIKANSVAIDYYANVDVIGDPVKSWDNLKYLEKEHGLTPVPVIHQGTELNWIAKHIEAGYDYIGFGGNQKGRSFNKWLEKAFTLLCDAPDKCPCVKVHGFGIGGFRPIVRFPFYSIDTVRWVLLGSRGYLVVPRMKKGLFTFTEEPLTVKIGNSVQQWKDHLKALSTLEQEVVGLWLSSIGLEIATILQDPANWLIAYLNYYECLRRSLPAFPRPFAVTPTNGIFSRVKQINARPTQEALGNNLTIYYSGNGLRKSHPEISLKEQANIMLTFFDQPSKRFQVVLEARQTGLPVAVPASRQKTKIQP